MKSGRLSTVFVWLLLLSPSTGHAAVGLEPMLSALPAQHARAVSDIFIAAPAVVQATEGDTISITANAGSGDFHSILQIRLAGQPPGLSLTYWGWTNATLSGILGFDTAGTWTLSWTVRDQFGAYDSTSTTLVIEDNDDVINLPPLAEAGGPYEGIIGEPLEMTGSAYDPEGDALTYIWDFGDGIQGAGPVVNHTYLATGRYAVRVIVSDGVLVDEDETTATITDDLRARVFVTGGDKTLTLASGKPEYCFYIEPVGDNFRIEDVDLLGFNLHYAGVLISSIPGKTGPAGDRDRNGVPEITACFARANLRGLFADLTPGTHEVPVTLEGFHLAGNRIRGSIDLKIQVRNVTSLSVTPNPLNPSGTLVFTTLAPGPVRVRLFDVNGRLLRTMKDSVVEHAGTHRVEIDARDARGRGMASGVYFIQADGPGLHDVVRVIVSK